MSVGWRSGVASRWGETHQAPGGGINAWRQGRFDHLSPGRAVIVGHPTGEFQKTVIQEGFRIEDILNLFEPLYFDLLWQMHEIAGSDPGPERDDDALAWGGEIPQVRRDEISQGLVYG